MRAPDLSIVIPVYNNADTLDELIDRLCVVLEGLALAFEIILADDGSTDTSLEILTNRAQIDPRIRVFPLARNFGSQSAVCAGFDQVRGRWALCMDADLENRPEDIPALIEPLRHGIDLVCGYRQERDAPVLSRRIPSWLMNVYVRRKTGKSIRDAGCGMRSFQSWVIHDLGADGEARRLMTPLFLQRARTVAEVPVTCGAKKRTGGHSFLSLLSIAADYYLYTARRPFLTAGLVAAAAAVVGGLAVIGGGRHAALALLLGGLLGTLTALVGEFAQRLYQLSQRHPFYVLRPEHGPNGPEVARPPRARRGEIDLSVIVPVYNNRATLDELTDRILAVLRPMERRFEIVFIDDGSTDDSRAILDRRAAAEPEIRVHSLARNFGGQAASCAACDFAIGRHVVHIDADLENFPEDIPTIVTELDAGYDFVLGYRVARRSPWLTRRLPSWAMNAFIRRRTGFRIRDVGCGLCGTSAALVADLASEGEARRLLKPLLLQRARGVTEVPVRHRAHDEGGHNFFSLLAIAADYYLYAAKRPFLIAGLAALAAIAVGAAASATGVHDGGGMLLAAGFLGAVIALIGDYLQRVYQLIQGIPFYQLREAPSDTAETADDDGSDAP